MNTNTGREFSFQNPQDDPHLYPPPPVGYAYTWDGRLIRQPTPLRTTPSQSSKRSEICNII